MKICTQTNVKLLQSKNLFCSLGQRRKNISSFICGQAKIKGGGEVGMAPWTSEQNLFGLGVRSVLVVLVRCAAGEKK